MEKELLNMPGYRFCEYMLVLQPHEELWNKIMHVKEEFEKKYDCPSASWTKPQITLVKFVQYEMMEERIVNRLKTICMGLPAFKVELKDYGSFPSHTIHINVTSKVSVVHVIKELRHAQRLMKINNDNKPYFITEPYLTIARKLLPWQYEKAWTDYSNKSFTGRFIAENAVLLKRSAGQKGCHVAERLSFQNLPVYTKQGELFV
jgi:2'-5' RNA ligase